MPGNLTNTLYPPTVQTFMPAFVYNTSAKVYFSLSPFNESTQIKKVHVSVVNQLNNENALKTTTGIYVDKMSYDTSVGMYFVEIPTIAMQNNTFNINQFYKIQLRFDQTSEDQSSNIGPNTSDADLNTYLLNHQESFSEWSTVCLIRPIAQPFFAIKPFDTQAEGSTIAFNKGIIPISGSLYFAAIDSEGNLKVNKSETETMQSFKLDILGESDKVVLSSPLIYTGDNLNPNSIYYRMDLQGLNTDTTIKFKLRVTATTVNQYVYTNTYEFQIAEYLEEEKFKPIVKVDMDNENGVANLSIKNEESVFGIIYVKRSSSISDFKEWEDIYSAKIAGPIDLKIADNTVGSLVWYRYSVQLENSRGALTQVFRSTKFLPDFYDAIFSRGSRQLKLKYNYKISSFKPVVNRSKIDTLGGRFPKFAENAVLNYKQFSISGLIAADLDAHQKFLNKQSYFGNDHSNYLVYKEKYGIKDLVRNDVEGYVKENGEAITSTWYDWFWEREFREEVVKWLNDGEPKLYRSMTEGAMVVMLTDVSLTPNASLGRMMWDFTATVYEIAEADSLSDLDTLGIYSITKVKTTASGGSGSSGGSENPDEYVVITKPGQLYNYTVINKNTVLTDILDNLKKTLYESGSILGNKAPEELYLKNVKLFFQSKPNVFEILNNGELRYSSNGLITGNNPYRLGYTFNVNVSGSSASTMFFVNERGYYQLPNDLDITGLSFNQEGDIVTVEYTVVYKEKNTSNTTISGSAVDKTIVGQYEDVFLPDTRLGEKIRSKYSFVTTSYSQRMQFWKGICLDVNPYAVAYIKYKDDNSYNEYVVGGTGVLHMLKDYKVQDIFFYGRKMNKRPAELYPYLEEWEYVLDSSVEEASGEKYTITKDVQYPQLNTVYKIGGNLKIYYQYEWYDFIQNSDNTGIARVPIEGTINYYGDVLQVNY